MSPPTMRILYELAERQAGYFTSAQAVDAGVSRRVLSGRTQAGDIERVRYGLYRLRDFPDQAYQDIVAVCLWAGQDCVASHETALMVHGISDAMPASIHITVPRVFRGRQAGVIIHHAPLPEADRETRDGVAVTTIARTLQDVAATSDPSLVQQAVDQAVRHGVLTRRQLRKIVRETPALGPLVVGALADD